MLKTFLHLVNVNEDPQLTGVLRYFIPASTPPWWLILVLLMPPDLYVSFLIVPVVVKYI